MALRWHSSAFAEFIANVWRSSMSSVFRWSETERTELSVQYRNESTELSRDQENERAILYIEKGEISEWKKDCGWEE